MQQQPPPEREKILRWVKASERLPGSQWVVIRDSFNKMVIYGRKREASDSWETKDKHAWWYEETEWLEEISAPAASPVIDTAYLLLKNLIDTDQAFSHLYDQGVMSGSAVVQAEHDLAMAKKEAQRFLKSPAPSIELGDRKPNGNNSTPGYCAKHEREYWGTCLACHPGLLTIEPGEQKSEMSEDEWFCPKCGESAETHSTICRKEPEPRTLATLNQRNSHDFFLKVSVTSDLLPENEGNLRATISSALIKAVYQELGRLRNTGVSVEEFNPGQAL